MSDGPGTIYLQWFGDSDPEEPAPIYVPEVTWSINRIYEGDVEYVRVCEVVCVWSTHDYYFLRSDAHKKHHTKVQMSEWTYCPYCGGRIVREDA